MEEMIKELLEKAKQNGSQAAVILTEIQELLNGENPQIQDLLERAKQNGTQASVVLLEIEEILYGEEENLEKAKQNGSQSTTILVELAENRPLGPIPVDLGLPSGKLWADHNIGAKKASDAGLYFSWGNVQGVAGDDAAGIAAMTKAAYASTSGAGLDEDIPATAANDAAVANVGGNWRMPTKAEFQELRENCDWTWKQVNGVYGYEVKSKASGNTNSIFLPAAGYVDDGTLYDVGAFGDYWSSSIYGEDEGNAYDLSFNSEGVNPDNSGSRYCGCSVRPVQNAQ